MAEKPPAVTPPSLAELRAGFETTRIRIARQIDEVEARLRTQVDGARHLSGLKGSAALGLVAGAAAGFVAMRRWTRRRT